MIDVEEIQKTTAMTWDQKDSLKAQADIINAKTRYLETIKSLDKEQIKLAKTAKTRFLDRIPFWATMWIIYLTSWIFLIMIFRANVYPR